MTQQFQYEGATLSYSKRGEGQNYLLAFHGFGQNHAAFDVLPEKWAAEFTIITFELPFHGASNWPTENMAITRQYWKELLESFLNENKIASFSLIGFSIGAKLALASLEAFPDSTRELFLLAPDGIEKNFWYTFATHPMVAPICFRPLIKRPKVFSGVLKISQKLGMIDAKTARFVQSQMNTEEKRKRVYSTWMCFRSLRFDRGRIASVVNSKNIRLWLVVAKNDPIIHSQSIEKLAGRINSAHFVRVDASHSNLIEAGAKELTNIRG